LNKIFKNKELKGLIKANLKKVKLRECGSVLEIEYTLKKTDTMDDHVMISLFDIKNTLKAIHDSPELEKFETIKFLGMTLTKDINRKFSWECGIQLIFDLVNLCSVDYNTMTLEQLLSLQAPYKIGVTGAIRKELTEDAMLLLYPAR